MGSLFCAKKLDASSKMMWRFISMVFVLKFVACDYENTTDYENTCMSKECIGVSHRIFEHMDEKVDPCQNFYNFACGTFTKTAVIPDDKTSISPWTPMKDKIVADGKRLLELPIDHPNDFESDKMAKVFYKSCMDQEKLDEIGVEPVRKIISQLGGWPVVDGWNDSDTYNVWEQSVKQYHMGFSSDNIASFYISADAKNNSYRVLHFDQASLGLSKEYWDKGMDEPEVKAYFKYMVDTAILFGEEEIAKTEMRDVMNFESKLAKISAPKEERRNDTKLYNPTTLGEMSTGRARSCLLCPWGKGKVLPKSWTTYIADIFHFDVFFKSLVTITDSEKVIIRDPKFFEQLSSVLESTDPKTLANYMAWRVVKSSMKYLGKEARSIRLNFNKVKYGVGTDQSAWKRCTKKVGFSNQNDKKTFQYVAGSMYARHIFDIEAKRQVDDMSNYIRKAFVEILQKIDWMDSDTKTEAFNKLEKMHQTLGYPEEYLDKDKIDNIHKGLKMREGDYFDNVLKLNIHFEKLWLLKLREVVDPYSWKDFDTVPVVNAFYGKDFNLMKFPAGILQGVFFNSKVPRYMNFGGIGMVIGHEITHGFDDKGRQRSAEGELKDWWKPETSKNFKEKAQCIISQYGNYTKLGLNINGINTQGENIADNGGIKEAYRGYENGSRRMGRNRN